MKLTDEYYEDIHSEQYGQFCIIDLDEYMHSKPRKHKLSDPDIDTLLPRYQEKPSIVIDNDAMIKTKRMVGYAIISGLCIITYAGTLFYIMISNQ